MLFQELFIKSVFETFLLSASKFHLFAVHVFISPETAASLGRLEFKCDNLAYQSWYLSSTVSFQSYSASNSECGSFINFRNDYKFCSNGPAFYRSKESNGTY